MTAITSPSCTWDLGATFIAMMVPAAGGLDGDLHLHRLENDENIALVDVLPDAHRNLPDVRYEFGQYIHRELIGSHVGR